MTDVFISHARSDNEFAKKLASALDERGLTVWYADQHSRLGDHWIDIIERAIENTENILVVLSENSVASEWVRAETAMALSQRDKRVVPVFSTNNADVPFLLRDIRGVDLSSPDTFSVSVDKLLQLLQAEKPLRESDIDDEDRSRRFRAQLEASILEQEKLSLEHITRQKTLALVIGSSVTAVISAVVAFSLIVSIDVLDKITPVLGLLVGVGLGIAGSIVGYWLTYSRRREGARK